MALRFCDSFDHYASGDLLEKWTDYDLNLAAISAGNGRNSTAGLYCSKTDRCVYKTLDNQATWIVGTAFQYGTADDSSRGILLINDAAINQVDVRLNADATLSITRNGTVLGTGTTVLTTATWYYLELKVTIHDSTGVAVLKINGVTELDLSNIDTKNTANAYADRIYLSGGAGNALNLYYDDTYICDATGSVNNDFLGDIRVIAHVADGAGNYAQWTPSAGSNYQNVDDNPPDDDTTYNSSSTAAQKDTFTLGDLPGGLTGTCKGIQVMANCRKDDAGSRTIRPMLRISSTDYSGTGISVGDSYLFQIREIWDQNPDTSAAFSLAEIDALEAGYELVS